MVFGSGFMAIYLGFSGQLGSIATTTSEQWLWTLIPTLLLSATSSPGTTGQESPGQRGHSHPAIGAPITTLLNFRRHADPGDGYQWAGAALLVLGSVAWLAWQKKSQPLNQAY